VIDPTYADRLRATIARKTKLRGAFTSQGLTEDNEGEIYKAQYALRALRQQLDTLNETAAPGQI
jgi:hypothetical protein